jgi:hypothetical protein
MGSLVHAGCHFGLAQFCGCAVWLMLGAILGALFCGWAVWFMLGAILGWPCSVVDFVAGSCG